MAKILCIEDEAALRSELVELFDEEGYESVGVCDGRQGLAAILSEKPDLVVCDITMPVMNGRELLSELRTNHSEFDEMPFIFLSALSDSDDIVEGMACGADDYLTKPIDIDLLLSKIQSRLRQAERVENKKQSLLTYMAHHDSLTGLANRIVLAERIEEALEDAETGWPFALLFLDLDRFKQVNDTLGHMTGDDLLKVVAKRLKACVDETDTIARMGGDEFAIVHSLRPDTQSVAAICGAIKEALRETVDLGAHSIIIDVSIGIAIAPADGESAEDLLMNADLALYRAKDLGRGQCCTFEPEMRSRMIERQQLEIDLRNALELDQFELYYQPLVDLQSGKIVCFEALLRWRHPERGFVSPEDFVPIAEDIGFIVPLGDWVIRQACRQLSLWPQWTRIAVNLSPLQLWNGEIVQSVFSALAHVGVSARRLELEMTENVFLENSDTTVEVLHNLRNLGALIVLDDFGTGYSSLSYLRNFPFDKLKVDRSFVKDLLHENGERAILEAVSEMSRRMGMTTTAEGVETEEQMRIVKQAGIGEMQGFLVSAPRPAAEISALFIDREEVSGPGGRKIARLC